MTFWTRLRPKFIQERIKSFAHIKTHYRNTWNKNLYIFHPWQQTKISLELKFICEKQTVCDTPDEHGLLVLVIKFGKLPIMAAWCWTMGCAMGYSASIEMWRAGWRQPSIWSSPPCFDDPIRYGRDCVEPAVKPGDLALVRTCSSLVSATTHCVT